jgi:hypothetical protein
MKRASALLGFTFACLSAASAAIDFTPKTGERFLSGVTFPQLIFNQDGREVVYEHPRGWSYTGGGPSIKFLPPNVSQASAEIQQVPLKGSLSFDEPMIKALQQQTLASVPQGSTDVALVAEESNPLRVNGNQTYEITVGYRFYGEDFQLSVLYINVAETQLRMRVVAPKRDFEKLHSAFRSSAVSFQGLKPAQP